MRIVARNEGLGTCWIGAFDHEELKQFLKIPEEYDVIALTPLGYPAREKMFRKTSSRKNLNEIIFTEAFGNSALEEGIV